MQKCRFCLTEMGPGVWPAALRSVAVALAAMAGAVALAFAIAALIVGTEGRRPAAGRAVEALGLMTLALSPFVTGVALFIALRPVLSPVGAALPLTAVVNAMMALPFALRILLPPLRSAVADFAPLAASLGMPPLARMRLIYLPRLRAPLGFAAGLAAALSMGDLGVIALFATPGEPTLPLYMYGLMASHQIAAAGGAALLLAVSSFGLFVLFDRWGSHAGA